MAEEVRILRKTVEDANVKLQRQSNELLGTIVNRAVGFGYQNAEELQLGVRGSINYHLAELLDTIDSLYGLKKS